MTDTYACTGTDLPAARETLAAVVAEIYRRNEVAMRENQRDGWKGPKLNLTVDHLPPLLADTDCLSLFEQVLRFGRKVGVTGVARGGREFYGPPGGLLVREFLHLGVPLRWEPSDAHTREMIAAG